MAGWIDSKYMVRENSLIVRSTILRFWNMIQIQLMLSIFCLLVHKVFFYNLTHFICELYKWNAKAYYKGSLSHVFLWSKTIFFAKITNLLRKMTHFNINIVIFTRSVWRIQRAEIYICHKIAESLCRLQLVPFHEFILKKYILRMATREKYIE